MKWRITSVTIVGNGPNHKGDESQVREAALVKARKILEIASKAPVEEENQSA